MAVTEGLAPTRRTLDTVVADLQALAFLTTFMGLDEAQPALKRFIAGVPAPATPLERMMLQSLLLAPDTAGLSGILDRGLEIF